MMSITQEVKDKEGTWINVQRTIPTICEAEECTNDAETILSQKEEGVLRQYFLCKYRSHCVTNGNSFRLKKRDSPVIIGRH
jgi:hypothetical protein